MNLVLLTFLFLLQNLTAQPKKNQDINKKLCYENNVTNDQSNLNGSSSQDLCSPLSGLIDIIAYQTKQGIYKFDQRITKYEIKVNTDKLTVDQKVNSDKLQLSEKVAMKKIKLKKIVNTYLKNINSITETIYTNQETIYNNEAIIIANEQVIANQNNQIISLVTPNSKDKANQGLGNLGAICGIAGLILAL